jgi:hypothetical protein
MHSLDTLAAVNPQQKAAIADTLRPLSGGNVHIVHPSSDQRKTLKVLVDGPGAFLRDVADALDRGGFLD